MNEELIKLYKQKKELLTEEEFLAPLTEAEYIIKREDVPKFYDVAYSVGLEHGIDIGRKQTLEEVLKEVKDNVRYYMGGDVILMLERKLRETK